MVGEKSSLLQVDRWSIYAIGRDSAVGSGVCKQRHAWNRVLPQSRSVAKYSLSPFEAPAKQTQSRSRFRGHSTGTSGVGRRDPACIERFQHDVTGGESGAQFTRLRTFSCGLSLLTGVRFVPTDIQCVGAKVVGAGQKSSPCETQEAGARRSHK